MPPLINKNRPLQHCLFSLSDLRCHIVLESCFYRWDPSYCFHRSVVLFHYLTSPWLVSCPIVSYCPLFKHGLEEFWGENCTLSIITCDTELYSRNIFSSSVTTAAVSACNSFHVVSYTGLQSIINKYAIVGNIDG